MAHILVNTVEEFKGMNPADVVQYIEGEPHIGSVPIDGGVTNVEKQEKVIGLNTENSEINEGMIRFDIIFYVRMQDGLSQIIVNVEAQKAEPSSYDILNRAIFYVSRMISSQKGRDFVKSEYFSKIKWIVKENEDIFMPDYTDVLRVAFTFKFLRGRISDLVSLLSGRDFATREYQESIAEESFNNLKEGVLEFVNQTNFQRYLMIVKSIGIISPALIRSQNVLNFGYALYLLLKNKNTDSAIIEKIVRKWILLCILTGRYSGSPESMFDYDIKRFYNSDPISILERTEAGELSDAFWNNILITKLETSVASSPMFHVFLMTQIRNKDKGFLSKEIDVQSLIEQRGDIHHIFPKKYLQKNGINERGRYNQIANYVYTQSEINIKIKDQAPKEYMNKVKEQCEGKNNGYGGIDSMKELQKNLNDNCIPEEIFNMDYSNYDEFLNKRRIMMAEKIKKFYNSFK